MNIEPIKFLDNGSHTSNYDSKKKIHKNFTGLDRNNNKEIEEAIAKTKDNKIKAKNS